MSRKWSDPRLFFALGAVAAATGVAAGAFGAHVLRKSISAEMLEVFETASRYQMYHSFGLIAVALVMHWRNNETSGGIATAGWLFLGGIILFSGSLYGLALTGQHWLGAITPLGGASFIAGWILLAWCAWRSPL